MIVQQGVWVRDAIPVSWSSEGKMLGMILRHSLKTSFSGVLLFLCSTSSAFADAPESPEKTADIMVYCAVLNAHVVREHGAAVAFVSLEKVKLFVAIAIDLTDQPSVISRMEKQAEALKEHEKSNSKEFGEQLSKGLAKCFRMDFSPAVVARLQLLLEQKKRTAN